MNIGLLDPSRKDALKLLRGELDSMNQKGQTDLQYSELRVFLVLGSQFISVLEEHYGVSSAQVQAMGATGIDPTLEMFLESEGQRAGS